MEAIGSIALRCTFIILLFVPCLVKARQSTEAFRFVLILNQQNMQLFDAHSPCPPPFEGFKTTIRARDLAFRFTKSTLSLATYRVKTSATTRIGMLIMQMTLVQS